MPKHAKNTDPEPTGAAERSFDADRTRAEFERDQAEYARRYERHGGHEDERGSRFGFFGGDDAATGEQVKGKNG